VRWLASVAGGLVVLGLVLWGVLVVSMRTGYTPVLDLVRRVNRMTNAKVMRRAGKPGSGVAVIEHVGRVSGAEYSTPVTVAETDTGFAVVLPYGTRPDWLRNVLAAGRAKVIHEGVRFEVGSPVVLSDGSADHFFPPRQLRANRLYGIDQVLVLQDSAPVGEART
jgi:deazaflavin-dependent oxidoreductase (nitroreductase family)